MTRDANAPLTEAEMKLLSPAERRLVIAARKGDLPYPLLIPDHVHSGSPFPEPGRIIREQDGHAQR